MTASAAAGATQPAAIPPPDQNNNWLLGLVLGFAAIAMIGFVGITTVAVTQGGSGEAATMSTTLNISLQEFSITGELVAPAGEVSLLISNKGSMVHNVVSDDLDKKSNDVGAGGTTSLSLGVLSPGTYEIYCDIPGHKTSGMVAYLTVVADGSQLIDTEDHSLHGEDTDWAALDAAMMETMLAFPAETEGSGNPVLEPTEVLGDGTKVFDLEIAITPWEVEPGIFVDAWTYNGVVPGPQLNLDRGDSIQVRVVNNLPMGTDIHWHGVHTPNDQDGVAPYTQDLIAPDGGEFTYEFTVEEDAIGMYHAHNHGQMQIVNGLFGTITIGENPVPYGQTISGVEIPMDLEISQYLPMVLNDAGVIGFSLNGKSFPATEPLIAEQGEWISLTYYNEGLQIHPMHLHQFPQLVYAKDGIPLDQPYWVDTLNVAPGERYTVLFRPDDPGVWVWHCHILSHVEREEGMFGMVTAIIVNEVEGYDKSVVPVQPANWRNVVAGTPVDEADHAAASTDGRSLTEDATVSADDEDSNQDG